MENTAKQSQSEHSAFVSILAWIFIAFSAFSAFIGIFQNIMINSKLADDQLQGVMHSANDTHKIAERLFLRTFLTLSAVTFASSIALFKRKNWARVFFICLMCFGIVWTISTLVLLIAAFLPIQHSRLDEIAYLFFISYLVTAIGMSALFVWIIKRLTSFGIRKEFENSKSSKRVSP